MHRRSEAGVVCQIPWNPMLAKDGAEPYDAPNPDNIEKFHQILKASGIPVRCIPERESVEGS
jgi:adenine C2-methylase RlmN of 23S rRNA A2503 and tRNA A37